MKNLLHRMFYLGIDIGTTSISTIIMNGQTQTIESLHSCHHISYIINENGVFEQDANLILSKTLSIIQNHPKELLNKICAIGITGQMHGVILWSSEKHSNLITWEDKRASQTGKLHEINKISGCEGLRDGFGFTSLSILAQDGVLKDHDYKHCGTIMDYLCWYLCGKPDVSYIDSTNAASWGLYDIKTNTWDLSAINLLGIPQDILPSITVPGSILGHLCKEYADKLSIPENIKIITPIGDNQASVIGSCNSNHDDEIYVTFGTGCQLSMVLQKERALQIPISPTYELRPFLGNNVLIVTAPLCGGNAWALLKNFCKEILNNFGVTTMTDTEIFSKLDELALAEIESTDLPIIEPHFSGERWDVDSRGIIKSINMHNFTIGKIAAALILGMMKNLKDNIPKEFFLNKKLLVANGNAISLNKSFQRALELVFSMPFKISEQKEEATVGAAMLAMLS